MVTKISKQSAGKSRPPSKGKPIQKASAGKNEKMRQKYQDKYKRRKERKDQQKQGRNKQRESDGEEEPEIDGSDYDAEIDQIQEELDQDKHLDETIFNKLDNGELDLPSEQEDSDSDASMDQDEDDLDEYYRELGIDPDEMKPEGHKKQSKPEAEYASKPKRETDEQAR